MPSYKPLSALCLGLTLASILSLGACQEGQEPSTPLVPVSLRANLQTPTYRSLLSPSQAVAISTPRLSGEALGYGGLLIVHGLEWGAFYAFDLACPYENSPTIRLSVEGLKVACPQCHTAYDVWGGSGASLGPVGRKPLRRYRCTYDEGTKTLSISH